jgi:sugar lactone lactonase YvrE
MAPGEKEEAGPEPSAGEKSEFEPLLSPLQEGMEPVFLPSQEEAGDFGPGSLAPPPSQEGEAEAIAEPEAESPFLPGFEEDERQEEAPGPEMQTEEGGSPPSSPPVSPEAESPFLSEGGESPYLAPKEGSALPPAPIQPPSPLPLAADVFTLGAGDGSLYFTNGASQVRTLEMYGLTTAKSIAVLKGWLFIANGVRNAVKAVPISDRAKEVDISVGKNAFDVLASVSAGTILALSSSSNEMDVIDAKKKVSEMAIKLPGTPLGGAVSQKDGNAYITFSTKKGGGVAMYRSNGAADVVYRFPPEFAASQANSALDEEKGILYVPIAEQPAILRIDIFSKRILGLFSLPGKPASIAFNPKNGRLYIADSASGQILVADANTGVITTAAPLEKKPAFGQIALDAENSRLYVPAKNSGKVFVVDTQENEAVDSWHQPEAFYAAVRPGA